MMTDINEVSNLGRAVTKLEARDLMTSSISGGEHTCSAHGGDLYVAMRMEAVLSMEAGLIGVRMRCV